MFFEKLLARSDKMFHDHGDWMIKFFAVLVALVLIGLYFLSTSRSFFDVTALDKTEILQ